MAASYPTSVKSFTTKNTSDAIQAAHVNDLQDEVAAIEGGLLNGTAPLNSSNSTLAALSVTGNSTVTNLNVTGGCTLASFSISNLQVSSNSTLTNLSVTGGSTFATVNQGASTLASLSVTGNSTLAAVNQGASTLASLSVTGGSTLASLSVTGDSTLAAVNQGNSTVANLSVTGGSTFAGAVMPAADSTQTLGSSSVRWVFSGKQITPGSIPSTALSTSGTPSTSAFLTGGGWQESTARLVPVVYALPSTITFTGDAAETV